mmetsp:Transcript_22640/g.72516  ORF Transcript_22640/g.72516 Transcript_22640/m.72516 type:complete len:433 (-) Transcript_22640:973-2271(-)
MAVLFVGLHEERAVEQEVGAASHLVACVEEQVDNLLVLGDGVVLVGLEGKDLICQDVHVGLDLEGIEVHHGVGLGVGDLDLDERVIRLGLLQGELEVEHATTDLVAHVVHARQHRHHFHHGLVDGLPGLHRLALVLNLFLGVPFLLHALELLHELALVLLQLAGLLDIRAVLGLYRLMILLNRVPGLGLILDLVVLRVRKLEEHDVRADDDAVVLFQPRLLALLDEVAVVICLALAANEIHLLWASLLHHAVVVRHVHIERHDVAARLAEHGALTRQHVKEATVAEAVLVQVDKVGVGRLGLKGGERNPTRVVLLLLLVHFGSLVLLGLALHLGDELGLLLGHHAVELVHVVAAAACRAAVLEILEHLLHLLELLHQLHLALALRGRGLLGLELDDARILRKAKSCKGVLVKLHLGPDCTKEVGAGLQHRVL